MAFTTITVTGTYTRPDGTPAAGTITVTLSHSLRNGTAQLDPQPIVATLNPAGQVKNSAGGPLTLAANDDTGTIPAGSFYTFLLELDSTPVRSFTNIVPHAAAAGTIDLSALDPESP